MLLSQRIRKRYHKTLWTSVINSPLSPLSLITTLDQVQYKTPQKGIEIYSTSKQYFKAISMIRTLPVASFLKKKKKNYSFFSEEF